MSDEIGEIRAFPTFVLFVNGRKADSMMGDNPGQLVQLLQNAQAHMG